MADGREFDRRFTALLYASWVIVVILLVWAVWWLTNG